MVFLSKLYKNIKLYTIHNVIKHGVRAVQNKIISCFDLKFIPKKMKLTLFQKGYLRISVDRCFTK